MDQDFYYIDISDTAIRLHQNHQLDLHKKAANLVNMDIDYFE